MSKLFPGYNIDLENGGVINTSTSHKYGFSVDENGYVRCKISDYYGNKYYRVHEIIIAEGLGLPKHLWPVDENGRRYVVDHIIPVKNGGTNAFNNLHLIPKSLNNRNAISRINSKNGTIKYFKEHPEAKNKLSDLGKLRTGVKNNFYGKKHSEETKKHLSSVHTGKEIEKKWKKVYQYTLDDKLVKIWDSIKQCGEKGFNISCISDCCRGRQNKHKGYKWLFGPL